MTDDVWLKGPLLPGGFGRGADPSGKRGALPVITSANVAA